jgi:hypothetical protein
MSLLNQSIIKHKMGLLNLAEELRNVVMTQPNLLNLRC